MCRHEIDGNGGKMNLLLLLLLLFTSYSFFLVLVLAPAVSAEVDCFNSSMRSWASFNLKHRSWTARRAQSKACLGGAPFVMIDVLLNGVAASFPNQCFVEPF